MIAIDNTLVSDDLLEKRFVCDLAACKGACCVEGDSGAPLEDSETKKLEDVYPVVKSYMTKEGIKAVEKQGTWVIDSDGDKVTPLVGGDKECAYTGFDEKGIAYCTIERAWKDGKVKFRKPVSCHLYPVRITKHATFDAVNYESWNICKPACACGEKLNVPVYVFVKDALIVKYGKDWYKKLELAAKEKNV
ncbi:MAG: hypothetical protein FD123_40 [Bacteroidetes bacterium]|nr:MAG: hypothetical protein FD123_40 [Bacteroidota bacterium]